MNVKGIQAKAIVGNEGIVVLAGAEAAKIVKESLSTGYKKLRSRLIDRGVLVDSGETLKFVKDQLFTSPSQAAAVIVGYAINGRQHWKTSAGITLKQMEENSITILSKSV